MAYVKDWFRDWRKVAEALSAGTYEIKVWLGTRLVKVSAVTIPAK